jgi:hypothetical protein
VVVFFMQEGWEGSQEAEGKLSCGAGPLATFGARIAFRVVLALAEIAWPLYPGLS